MPAAVGALGDPPSTTEYDMVSLYWLYMLTAWVLGAVADTLEGLGAHCSLAPVEVLKVIVPVASNQ